MNSYFKIFLITLISCCYVNTVFEFSDEEKKSNFENETHSYIQQDNIKYITNIALQSITKSDILFNILPHFDFIADTAKLKSYSFYEKHFFQPKNRLFIIYSTFLI